MRLGSPPAVACAVTLATLNACYGNFAPSYRWRANLRNTDAQDAR